MKYLVQAIIKIHQRAKILIVNAKNMMLSSLYFLTLFFSLILLLAYIDDVLLALLDGALHDRINYTPLDF